MRARQRDTMARIRPVSRVADNVELKIVGGKSSDEEKEE